MRNLTFFSSLIFLVLFLSLLLVPWDAIIDSKISLTNMLAEPSLMHPFGTDNLGRDLLLRVISAIYDTVFPIWLTVLSSFVWGIIIAIGLIVSSNKKGFEGMTKFFQLSLGFVVSIPIGVLVFFLAAIQEKVSIQSLLTTLFVLLSARVVQKTWNLYLHDKELGYWLAHESLGGGLFKRVVLYGVANNWRASLLEVLFFQLQASLVIEAGLSYLGFGIAEPKASFGNMLASHFNLYLKGDWHILLIVVFSFLCVSAIPAASHHVISRSISMARNMHHFGRN